MNVRLFRNIGALPRKTGLGLLFLGVLSLSAPSALAQVDGGGAPAPIRIDPATCPLPPAGGSVSCPGPDGTTVHISATPGESPQQGQPQAPGGGCLAANGSVCSGQGTAIDGSVSSGCATAVNDSTASGGNCPTTTPTTRGERIIDRIVPTPTTVVLSPQPVPPGQPAQPSAPRQLALTG